MLLSLPLLALVLLTLSSQLSPGPATAADKRVLDANLPYQALKSNPVTYDVDFSSVVTAPSHTKLLKVWLPLPQTDFGQEVEEKQITTFPLQAQPQTAREATFGNQFAYFEFAHPEGAQIIRHHFKIKVWELHWDIDPARVSRVETWPGTFDRYLRSEQTVVVDDHLRKIARQVVPERHGPGRDLEDVITWVNRTMKYNHANASLRASSEHALEQKEGHCSDYHGLCAALGRALGYPTRVTYGINAFPKNSPSHCKLEAFLPPYGWVSFDVSETQNLITSIQKDPQIDTQKKTELIRAANERLFHGFRDNTWYVQTRGTDYDLAPPAMKRVPVVRTLYAEADGVILPDPDPANPQKHEFAWMTVQQFTPDRPVSYPFKDWKSLLDKR